MAIDSIGSHDYPETNRDDIPHPVRLAELYFDLAVQESLQPRPETNYLVNRIKGPLITTEFVLLRDKRGQVMNLNRYMPGQERPDSPFVYWLLEGLDGFEADTGMPTTVEIEYHMDSRGNFYRKFARGMTDIIVPVDDHTTLRLLQFLQDSDIVAVEP